MDVNNWCLHFSQTLDCLYNHFKKPRPTEKSYLITYHRSDKSHLPVPVSPQLTLKLRLIINITNVYNWPENLSEFSYCPVWQLKKNIGIHDNFYVHNKVCFLFYVNMKLRECIYTFVFTLTVRHLLVWWTQVVN